MNMIIYFKRTRDIFGIHLRNQGISVLLKGTLTEKNKGTREFNDREQGRKSVIFNGSEGNMLPSSPSPWAAFTCYKFGLCHPYILRPF